MYELTTLVQTLWQIVLLLLSVIVQLLDLLLRYGPVLLWIAWALLAVNWPKAWQALRQGAWAPLAFVIVLIALVWSQVMPSTCECLRIVSIPNFWWQLGEVSMYAAFTLFLGWLQGILGWTPATIDLEPATAHGHGHEAGHAHH